MSLPRTEADAVAVADRVLKRVEVSKIARRLQDRLALAQFKTKNGWEDLTLDKIEPRVEEERRLRRLAAANSEFDHISDASSTASDLPYPRMANGLMSSPLKAPAPLFSDAILTPSASGSGTGRGQRKRSYMVSFDDEPTSGPGPARTLFNPTKRIRAESPTAHKSFPTGHATWKDLHQLAQSSPIKPRKHHKAPARAPTVKKPTLKQSHVLQPPPKRAQPVTQLQKEPHFTTATGPSELLFPNRLDDTFTSPPFTLMMSDDEDEIPIHSFNVRSSPPPRTPPPMRSRGLVRSSIPDNITIRPTDMVNKEGNDGAGLLMYLANSPTAKRRPSTTTLAMLNGGNPSTRMEPPRTPPPKTSMLPSSLMTTPGGSNLFSTPGQTFDFADYVNITPSPAQKTWARTPVVLPGGARTPISAKRLEFPSEFR